MALQDSGSKVARIFTSTLLVSWAPHSEATYWNAFNRCWPSVVPGLPPTGATAVGSLKPMPAALPLTIVIVAAACAAAAAANSEAATAPRSQAPRCSSIGGRACSASVPIVIGVDPIGFGAR